MSLCDIVKMFNAWQAQYTERSSRFNRYLTIRRESELNEIFPTPRIIVIKDIIVRNRKIDISIGNLFNRKHVGCSRLSID